MIDVKKKRKRIKQNMTSFLELPKEAMLHSVRMVMLNNNEMLIENHQGISEYTQNTVKVDTQGYVITVMGNELILLQMGKDDISIRGTIQEISYRTKG